MPLPLAPLPALAPLPPLGALPGLAPAVPMAPYQRIGQPLFTPGIIPFLSLIMPLMVLPKLFEDPGRVIAGFTLRPILQGNQFSGLMRSMMMNGQDPRERDQLIRDMMLPTACEIALAPPTSTRSPGTPPTANDSPVFTRIRLG